MAEMTSPAGVGVVSVREELVASLEAAGWTQVRKPRRRKSSEDSEQQDD